jgi:hypothetical protein
MRAAQAADHVEPVHIGQHHVEHDEIGPVPLRGLDRLAPAGGGEHIEPGVAKAGGQQLKDVGLVLDNEKPGSRLGPPINRRHGHGLHLLT